MEAVFLQTPCGSGQGIAPFCPPVIALVRKPTCSTSGASISCGQKIVAHLESVRNLQLATLPGKIVICPYMDYTYIYIYILCVCVCQCLVASQFACSQDKSLHEGESLQRFPMLVPTPVRAVITTPGFSGLVSRES